MDVTMSCIRQTMNQPLKLNSYVLSVSSFPDLLYMIASVSCLLILVNLSIERTLKVAITTDGPKRLIQGNSLNTKRKDDDYGERRTIKVKAEGRRRRKRR